MRLFEAFVHEGFVFLVFEKLYGENVARSLSLKHKYTEYQVSSIIKQVRHFVVWCWFALKLFKPPHTLIRVCKFQTTNGVNAQNI